MTVPAHEPDAADINQIIAGYADKLDEIHVVLAMESAGVAQAVDGLRKALDIVEQCLDERQYEEVANLGYRDVSSEFIFLQRTMGALLTQAHQRSAIVSDIAAEARMAYEEVAPLVEKWSQARDSTMGKVAIRPSEPRQ